MPRIPRNEQTVAYQAPRIATPAAGAGLVALGGGLQQTADRMDVAAERVRREEEALAHAETVATARTEWARRLARAEEGAAPGAPDFAPTLLRDFDAYADEVRGGVADERARRRLDVSLTELRGAVEGRAMQFEAGARLADRRQRSARIVDLNASAALADPTAVERLVAETEEAIGATGLSGPAREEAIGRARAEIATAGLRGLIGRDPDAAVRAIDAGRWAGLVPGERLPELRERAQTAVRVRESERKAERALAAGGLRLQLQDAVAALEDGRDLAIDDRVIRGTLDGPEAERWTATLADARETGRLRQIVSGADPGELAAERAAIAERLATGPVDGYRAAERRLALFDQEIQRRNQRLAADPAAYAATRPAVAEVLRQAAEAPDEARGPATERAVALSLAEQGRLGVPEGDRRVLTRAQAETFAARLSATAVPGADGAEGEQAADVARTLAGTYGRHWPQAYAEIAAAGKLPAPVLVLAGMTEPTQARAAAALGRALKTGEAAFKETIPAADRKRIDEEIATALAPFETTLRRSGGGPAAAAQTRQAVSLLAMQYRFEGMEATTAASRAAADVVNDRYSFHETFRVPRRFDGDRIADAADAALRALADVDPPPSANPRLEPGAVKAAYLRQIRRAGRWITAPDESGLILTDEFGQLVTAGGQPVRLDFAEAATGPRAAPRDPIERARREDMRGERAWREVQP